MAAYEVLLLNTAIPQIQAAQAGDTYVVPRDIAVNAALSVTGNTILGDASTDTVQVNGYMGVGGAGASTFGINVVNTALTGANQYGVHSAPTGTSAATTSVRAFNAVPTTAAASFTSANAVGFFAQDAVKGAGSTITSQHGLYIADQSRGTNNYGITSLVSSGTDKWNIYASGTAANYFAGNVGIGTVAPGAPLDVRGIASSARTSAGAAIQVANFQNLTSDTNSAVEIVFNNSTVFNGNQNSKIGFVRVNSPSAGDTDMYINLQNGGVSQQRLYLNSSGNLGIGTSAPTSTLHVVSTFSTNSVLFSRSGYFELSLQTTSAGGSDVFTQFTGPEANTNWYLGSKYVNATRRDLVALYESTERLRLSPTEAVFNDPGNDYDFRVESDTNTHALFVQGSDGNVGIGTSAPQAVLDLTYGANARGITWSSNATTQYANIWSSRTDAFLTLGYGLRGSTSVASGFISSVETTARSAVALRNGIISFYTDASATVTYGNAITPTERLRIKSAGQTRFVPLASDPAGAEAGDVYYNSGTNKLRLYDGSTWVDLN